VVVGADPLQAFSRATYTELWQVSLGHTTSTVATDDLNLWLATEAGNYSVGTNQGAVIWATDGVSSLENTSPALVGEWVFLATTRAVRSRRASDGVEGWSTQLPARPLSAIAAAGTMVFGADEAGGVHGLAQADGELLWSVDVDACGPPALDAGLLFVGSSTELIAIR